MVLRFEPEAGPVLRSERRAEIMASCPFIRKIMAVNGGYG